MSRVDRTGLHRKSVRVIVRVSVPGTELGRLRIGARGHPYPHSQTCVGTLSPSSNGTPWGALGEKLGEPTARCAHHVD